MPLLRRRRPGPFHSDTPEHFTARSNLLSDDDYGARCVCVSLSILDIRYTNASPTATVTSTPKPEPAMLGSAADHPTMATKDCLPGRGFAIPHHPASRTPRRGARRPARPGRTRRRRPGTFEHPSGLPSHHPLTHAVSFGGQRVDELAKADDAQCFSSSGG